jgi:hypothetical protein
VASELDSDCKKQTTVKQIFLTTAFALSFLFGYSQTSSDTTFSDITGEYKCTLPILSKDIQDLRVAIIPLDSIGKKHISWNDNQQQLTRESETKFERDLLSCKEDIILDSEKDTVKTKKEKTYCIRIGYEDHGMGKTYKVNYISFKKSNALVVIEFAVIWRYCPHGQDQEDLIKECEKEEANKRIRIDAFVDKVVNRISFYKVANK